MSPLQQLISGLTEEFCADQLRKACRDPHYTVRVQNLMNAHGISLKNFVYGLQRNYGSAAAQGALAVIELLLYAEDSA